MSSSVKSSPFQSKIPNSESNGQYQAGCKIVGVKAHPARFPARLPEFFIRMLTEPGDLVVDIFGGSNTTGMVAEREMRQWISFEMQPEYVAASAFRFLDKDAADEDILSIYNRILSGETVHLDGEMSPAILSQERSLTIQEDPA